MKAKFVMALIINAYVVSPTVAGDIYRWTDPNTGKLTTSPSLPTYPIKESRIAGQLPNGNVVEVILDSNAPEVKAIIEKRKAQEAIKPAQTPQQAVQSTKGLIFYRCPVGISGQFVDQDESCPGGTAMAVSRPASPDKKESFCKNLELKIGMKDSDIFLCFRPTVTNRSVGSYGVHEQWVYRQGSFRSSKHPSRDIYIYFENGILTSFQD